MSLDRDELLRQKALVEAHLAWLNRKLDQCASENKSPVTSVEMVPPSPAVPDTTPGIPLAPDTATPSGSFSGWQKAGCLVFTLLLCAGLLFLLFGLPYLIY